LVNFPTTTERNLREFVVCLAIVLLSTTYTALKRPNWTNHQVGTNRFEKP